jgi:hypothetical protein
MAYRYTITYLSYVGNRIQRIHSHIRYDTKRDAHFQMVRNHSIEERPQIKRLSGWPKRRNI